MIGSQPLSVSVDTLIHSLMTNILPSCGISSDYWPPFRLHTDPGLRHQYFVHLVCVSQFVNAHMEQDQMYRSKTKWTWMTRAYLHGRIVNLSPLTMSAIYSGQSIPVIMSGYKFKLSYKYTNIISFISSIKTTRRKPARNFKTRHSILYERL